MLRWGYLGTSGTQVGTYVPAYNPWTSPDRHQSHPYNTTTLLKICRSTSKSPNLGNMCTRCVTSQITSASMLTSIPLMTLLWPCSRYLGESPSRDTDSPQQKRPQLSHSPLPIERAHFRTDHANSRCMSLPQLISTVRYNQTSSCGNFTAKWCILQGQVIYKRHKTAHREWKPGLRYEYRWYIRYDASYRVSAHWWHQACWIKTLKQIPA